MYSKLHMVKNQNTKRTDLISTVVFQQTIHLMRKESISDLPIQLMLLIIIFLLFDIGSCDMSLASRCMVCPSHYVATY